MFNGIFHSKNRGLPFGPAAASIVPVRRCARPKPEAAGGGVVVNQSLKTKVVLAVCVVLSENVIVAEAVALPLPVDPRIYTSPISVFGVGNVNTPVL